MTADGLIHAVRGQLGLGRLLPLGGPADGVWLAEHAAAGVLREARHAVPRAQLTAVRVTLAEPDGHDWAAVRAANPAAPPSALPAGPLRVAAEVLAPADRPLPRTAEALRAALNAAARDRLGLDVAAVDLRVVGLIEDHPAYALVDTTAPPAEGPAADPVVTAALAVPGVRSAVRAPLPGDAVRVHLTVDPDHRVLDVALAVRTATDAGAVLVTGIG